MHLLYFLLPLLGVMFSFTYMVLSSGDKQFRKVQFLKISCWLGLPDILLKCLSACFFLSYPGFSQLLVFLLSLLIIRFLRVFLTAVSELYFPVVWVTANSQPSRTLLSILSDLSNPVIRMVSILLLISIFSLFSSLLRPFQVHQQQLVSPSSSCSTAFFQLSGQIQIFANLFVFFYLHSVVS